MSVRAKILQNYFWIEKVSHYITSPLQSPVLINTKSIIVELKSKYFSTESQKFSRYSAVPYKSKFSIQAHINKDDFFPSKATVQQPQQLTRITGCFPNPLSWHTMEILQNTIQAASQVMSQLPLSHSTAAMHYAYKVQSKGVSAVT